MIQLRKKIQCTVFTAQKKKLAKQEKTNNGYHVNILAELASQAGLHVFDVNSKEFSCVTKT